MNNKNNKFSIIGIKNISDRECLFTYKHNQTSVKVVFLDNEDINKSFNICVPNKPTNNEGYYHSIEHMLFGGSEKFDVKEPFNFITKYCNYTYANAITFKNFTSYICSSYYENDFEIMFDIYIDGIFKPKFSKYTFNEEVYNKKTEMGAVYNEMISFYDDELYYFENEINTVMFEDYRKFNPHGKYTEIQNVVYENLKTYYKQNYFENGLFFYFSGDINIDAYLDKVDKYIRDINIKPNKVEMKKPKQYNLFETKDKHCYVMNFEYNSEYEKQYIVHGAEFIFENNKVQLCKNVEDYESYNIYCSGGEAYVYIFFSRLPQIKNLEKYINQIKVSDAQFYINKKIFLFNIKKFGYRPYGVHIGINIAEQYIDGITDDFNFYDFYEVIKINIKNILNPFLNYNFNIYRYDEFINIKKLNLCKGDTKNIESTYTECYEKNLYMSRFLSKKNNLRENVQINNNNSKNLNILYKNGRILQFLNEYDTVSIIIDNEKLDFNKFIYIDYLLLKKGLYDEIYCNRFNLYTSEDKKCIQFTFVGNMSKINKIIKYISELSNIGKIVVDKEALKKHIKSFDNNFSFIANYEEVVEPNNEIGNAEYKIYVGTNSKNNVCDKNNSLISFFDNIKNIYNNLYIKESTGIENKKLTFVSYEFDNKNKEVIIKKLEKIYFEILLPKLRYSEQCLIYDLVREYTFFENNTKVTYIAIDSIDNNAVIKVFEEIIKNVENVNINDIEEILYSNTFYEMCNIKKNYDESLEEKIYKNYINVQ